MIGILIILTIVIWSFVAYWLVMHGLWGVIVAFFLIVAIWGWVTR